MTNGTPMLAVESLTELTCQILREREDRAKLVAECETQLAAQDRSIARLVERFENARKGFNQQLIDVAKTVLSIRGSLARAGGESADCVRDAIHDLADNDGAKLATAYFGVKDYDRWQGQRNDSEYGYGPKHGYITFAVEMSRAARDRMREGGHLTPDEVEAAIYYLANLSEIQQSKQAAMCVKDQER